MDNIDKQNEIPLDLRDNAIVNDLKKEFRKSLLIDIITCLAFSFVMPFLFRQINSKAIESMSFLNSWLLGLIVCTIIWSFKNMTLFNYVKRYYDFKNNKKIVIETKIKAIVHLKSSINISVTHQNYKYTGFQVMNERCYNIPSVNDTINLYFLPKTKIVLDMQKK
jgi:hypothetical protein